jgi:hypothetical protein
LHREITSTPTSTPAPPPSFHATSETTDTMAPKNSAKKIELKAPKGTRDWDGTDMVLRDKIFTTIGDVFSTAPRPDRQNDMWGRQWLI